MPRRRSRRGGLFFASPVFFALSVAAWACGGATTEGTGETGPGAAGPAGASAGGSIGVSGGAASIAAAGAAGRGEGPAPDYYVVGKGSCPSSGSGPSTEPSTTIYVVEIAYLDECTGLGGQHLVARDLDGPRRFFLGAHGCHLLPEDILQAKIPTFGVLAAAQTAALFTAGPCVSFGGGEPLTSDSIVRSVAVFGTEATARAYRAAL